MRSFYLILLTVVAIGGGFFAYTRLVPPPKHHSADDRGAPNTLPSWAGDPNNPIGAGTGAWVNHWDQNGQLVGRFRAAEYTPKTDGTYHLVKPEAELYEHDGQVVQLSAEQGDVRVGQAAQRSGMNGGALGMPSTGTLQDVTVEIYPDAATRDAGRPNLSARVKNAQFDNDTYRLFTAPVVDPATGKVETEADDVPVVVRGKDLDFDGTGLILYWNEVGHDLKSLEVAHGRRLRLKNTTALGGKEAKGTSKPASQPTTTVAAPATTIVAPAAGGGGAAHAGQAADRDAVQPAKPVRPAHHPAPLAEAAAPPAEPGRPTDNPAVLAAASSPPATRAAAATQQAGPRQYVATFDDNVRVVQEGQERVRATQMIVQFATQGNADGQTVGKPATAPAPPAAPETAGDERAVRDVAPSEKSAARHASEAATDERAVRERTAVASAAEDELPAGATPAPAETAAVPPATAPAAGTPAANTPATDTPAAAPAEPVVAPTTRRAASAAEPVDVFWTGKLRIVPAPPNATVLHSGQAVVGFTGSPVYIHQDDVDLTGRHVRYNSANGVARLEGVPGEPFRMVRLKPDGSVAATVVAQSLKYSHARQVAQFYGLGSATFPDPSNPGTVLRAGWAKSCVVTLAGAAGGQQLEINRAELEGDASVTDGPAGGDDKLRLTARDVAVDFDRPAPSTRPTTRPGKTQPPPSVRRVVASGDARCVIHDVNAPPKSIETDKLTIHTAEDPAGELYPRLITADGSVHASDGQQALRSQKMDVTLAPVPPGRRKAPKPGGAGEDQSRVELETLLATGDVHATGKDGATADGDALRVEVKDGQPLVTLVGSPPAVVTGNGGVLRGGELDLQPKGDAAQVPGPGTIDVVQASRPGAPPRPMHVAWEDSADVRGEENRVDVRGKVRADTTDARGTVNAADADHVILTLAPKPSTRPAGEAASPSTKPSGGALADAKVGLLNGKQVKQVTLLDNAQIDSVLTAADGSIVRRAHVSGDRIQIYVPEKQLVVPVRGRMLLEDHAKPARAGGPGEADAGTPAGGRGTTAFEWEQQFTFDQTARRAVMDGPVVIVHQGEGNADPVRMKADRVITDFEPAEVVKEPAKVEGAGPGKPPAEDDTPPLKVKEMRAEGHVTVTSKGTTIEAADMRYDPAAEILVARGREGLPVTVSDGQGRGGATFREVWLNTKTNQIIKMIDLTGQARE